MRTRWAAIGAAVAVSLGGGVVFVANAATTTFVADESVTVVDNSAVVYQPVTPCRLLDTRTASQEGVRRGAIGPTLPLATNNQLTNNDITVVFDDGADNQLTAESQTVTPKRLMGKCDPSATAGTVITAGHEPVAVVLNVTAIGANAASFVTLYPWTSMLGNDEVADTAARPFVSHLNPTSGQVPTPNAVTVRLSDTANPTTIGGATFATPYKAFRIYNNQGSVNILVDVVGYYYSQTVVSSVTRSLNP